MKGTIMTDAKAGSKINDAVIQEGRRFGVQISTTFLTGHSRNPSHFPRPIEITSELGPLVYGIMQGISDIADAHGTPCRCGAQYSFRAHTGYIDEEGKMRLDISIGVACKCPSLDE